MSDDIERCARLMGMKQSEVLEVVPADGGDLVRTHDGAWTLVRADGSLGHHADAPSAPTAAAEPKVEPAPEPSPGVEPSATPAPKRRGRA